MALALGCLLGKVFGGLKAHRKLCCGLGPGVPVGEVALALGVPAGEGVWRVWRVFWRVWRALEGVWRVWKVLEGLEGLEGFGGCLEGLEGFGGFGGFWSVCGLANGSFESQ